jgi:hypothetical protein
VWYKISGVLVKVQEDVRIGLEEGAMRSGPWFQLSSLLPSSLESRSLTHCLVQCTLKVFSV